MSESDPTAAPARDVVAARVQTRFMATPLTLDVPPAYHLLNTKSRDKGNALESRCPYYVAELSGACGIWRHRGSVCLTYFCKHSRGQVGLKFWKALEYLLQRLENALSLWCLMQLEMTDESMAQTLPDHLRNQTDSISQELDESVDEKAYRALWGNWAGHEAEFYRECGRLVSAVSAQRTLEIGGAEAMFRLRLVREAFDALLSTGLPHAVRPGIFRVQALENDQVQIVSYSEYAPLALPSVVPNLLPYFEGRTVEEAIKAIDEQEQIEIEPALVRKLLDFEILVAVEPEA